MIWLLLIGLGWLLVFASRFLGKETEADVPAIAPRPTQAPTRLYVNGLLQEHRDSIVWRTLIGLMCVCLGAAALFGPSELVGVALSITGVFCLGGAVGRVWALGCWKLDRWYQAEIGFFYVAATQVETDSEGDVSWVRVRICPAEVANQIEEHPSCLRWMTVRITPAGSSCDWQGKYLIVLTSKDGEQIACLHGTNQFFRTGGKAPSDCLKSRIPPW